MKNVEILDLYDLTELLNFDETRKLKMFLDCTHTASWLATCHQINEARLGEIKSKFFTNLFRKKYEDD